MVLMSLEGRERRAEIAGGSMSTPGAQSSVRASPSASLARNAAVAIFAVIQRDASKMYDG
jgi:hypothetical protein